MPRFTSVAYSTAMKKRTRRKSFRYGPNIKDWPKMYPMEKDMLLELAAVIHDPVTTTDELIPSGETSSYRSNPLKLSEFALSRRAPEYVGISKRIQKEDLERRDGKCPAEVEKVLEKVGAKCSETSFGYVRVRQPSRRRFGPRTGCVLP